MDGRHKRHRSTTPPSYWRAQTGLSFALTPFAGPAAAGDGAVSFGASGFSFNWFEALVVPSRLRDRLRRDEMELRTART